MEAALASLFKRKNLVFKILVDSACGNQKLQQTPRKLFL
ncbi:hypothetical protein B488_00760 [Liberibacter crescens BT-1]|uniref:Uncharacterized protein n=1 Tax=Liberibacter crescens (strain BT-1) TaxID=1215343 RepID=L0ERG6_LIBCB|nr:hypothetical protein B488_00760 [Liberibacter crescens BT-1]